MTSITLHNTADTPDTKLPKRITTLQGTHNSPAGQKKIAQMLPKAR